jgi:membrane protease YdiL (CAAX protease family)
MSNASSDEQQPKPASPKSAFPGVSWSPASAILITIVAFFMAQVAAAVLMGIVPGVLGWSENEITRWFETVSGQFIFVLAAEAMTILILWWFLKRRRASVRALGFHRAPVWKDLAYVGAGFGVYFVLLILVTTLGGELFNLDVEQKQDVGFDAVVSNPERLMAFVSLVILPPIVEEVVFRGFLYGGLRRKLRMWGAILVTSLMFAAPHLLASEDGGLLWVAAVDTFVLSVVLCYLREKTGNLWASIGVHAIKNGLAFIYLFILVGS